MKESTKDAVKMTISLVLVAALVIVAFVLGAGEVVKGIEIQPEGKVLETAPGMPLDAIQYAAPAWMPDAQQCFRVTDRQSGCSWWVIQVNSQWLVLPIEGKVESVG